MKYPSVCSSLDHVAEHALGTKKKKKKKKERKKILPNGKRSFQGQEKLNLCGAPSASLYAAMNIEPIISLQVM